MFQGCRILTNADSAATLPIAGEINIEGMFDNCSSLVETPIWIPYINPTNLNQTFFACTSLETVYDINCELTPADQIGFFEMLGACDKLKNVASLDNLGKGWIAIDEMYSETNTTTFNLGQSPLLTQQSVANIADSVYDMNLNTKTNAKIVFHKDVYNNIPEEVLAKFAAKKWTVASSEQ